MPFPVKPWALRLQGPWGLWGYGVGGTSVE